MLELEKLEAETRAAQLATERAQLELDGQRAALAAKRADAARREQEERAWANAPRFPNGNYYSAFGYRGPFMTGYAGYVPYGSAAYGNQWRHVGGGFRPAPSVHAPFSPMGPPGTSAPDPKTGMFNIPGWKDPRSYF
jgi:hypothetical protein